MGAKNYLPFQGINNMKAMLLEMQLLQKSYDFLRVKVIGNILYCHGICRPTELSDEYKYVLKFSIGKRPIVKVLKPHIDYDDNIHMYSDGSLCLYYPKDFSFTKQSHLYDTIIPWIHEWFVFYELYLIKGKWLHPYVEHKRI